VDAQHVAGGRLSIPQEQLVAGADRLGGQAPLRQVERIEDPLWKSRRLPLVELP
jgi:hypothetical protein